MKVSLNWIFDHIDGNVNDVDVRALVDTFIKTTAEIEEWRSVSCNPESLTLVSIKKIGSDEVVVYSDEHAKEYSMPFRSDSAHGSYYLAECKNNQWIWATMSSVGGSRDTLLPAIAADQQLCAGEWKRIIEVQDYILEVDNKSINHRPDLWGHKGIAREIAAMLNLPMKKTIELNQKETTPQLSGSTSDISIAIDASDVCTRFAAVAIDIAGNRASSLDMVIRLSRLSCKAIDFIVDATNYVMFDIGQPMHAFDAQQFVSKNIIVRCARSQEKLTLLDGESISLTSSDIVISDGDMAISLAGVMGGMTTEINKQTRSVLLEAAHFDAATIRRTAARYKKRTEASMRFEKNLDPNYIDDAIVRFVDLLDKQGMIVNKHALVILGQKNAPVNITVSHEHVEQLLGVTVSTQQVKNILEKLCFEVTVEQKNNKTMYNVHVPSFRATKDIGIAEDIIEEIGRFVGYDSILPVMPPSQRIPVDARKTYRVRTIKNMLTSGLLMRELYGYSFFDELFLNELAWQPQSFVELKNPISEHYTKLVTTLQPHLLKAIKDNSIHHAALRFYEWGRSWSQDSNGDVVEKKSLSGIFFDQHKTIDFYEGKLLLSRLFKELHCDVTWEKNDGDMFPWLWSHQTARIMHNNQCIGIAGMVEDNTIKSLSPAGGTAFLFECDGDFLVNYKHSTSRFVSLPKYPCVYRDVSIMVPLSITVDTITNVIRSVDDRIKKVTLVDFFTKKEWNDQKSLTFHIELYDASKTLNHDEVEVVWSALVVLLEKQGATIR